MKKRIFYICSLLLVVYSCQRGESDNQLNVYIRNKPFGINPSVTTNFYQERLVKQIFEGLYDYHYLKDPYEVMPLIAEDLPQIRDNGLTYIIRLKKDVKFSDDPCFVNSGGTGRYVTAKDVVYSLKHYAAFPPYNKAYFVYYIKGLMEYREKAQAVFKKGGDINRFVAHQDVEGLRVLDDYTIGIRLRQRCPYFLETLTVAGASIIAREAVEHYGKEIDWHPVGTGPYMLAGWGNGEKITLVKNSNYRYDTSPSGEKIPFVDEINFYFIADDKIRKEKFDKGELDIYTPEEDYFYEYFPTGKELADKYKKRGDNAYIDNNVEFTGLLFNMTDPLIGKNTNLRKAIALTFNNAKNLEVSYYMSQILAHWVIPPHVYGYDPSYVNPYSKYDIKEAEALLSKAGYPSGNKLPELVLLLLTKEPVLKRIGEFFVDSASKSGLKIKMEFVDSQDEIKETLAKKDKKIHMFFVSEYSTFSTPEKMLRLFYKGHLSYKTNHSGYYNPKYERLFEQVVLLDNSSKKIELINEMRDMVVNDCVFIPLSFTVLYRITHGYIKNYRPHLMSFDRYKYIRVDTKEKERYLKHI